ncbi:MAG: alpha/beta hydrolase [Actinomycetota bacterium]|nr:alpha/beta hydrolase [Actinomycetota bacterium]
MRIMAGLLALLALVVAVVLLIFLTQRRLLYFPDARHAFVVDLPGHAVTLRTSDGLDLAAWYLPPTGPDTGTRVLVCNGNAGNFADRAPLARVLSARGMGVLLFDYRGYGGNAGRPSEVGLAADADAAQRWLTEHGDGDRLVYFGESVGAAVAAGLAQRRPPAGLVLRSPFPSLAAAARVQLHVPVGWLLRDHYRVTGAVRAASVPLLVIVAADDEIIPPALSRQVYEAAPEPKRLVEVDGAGHNDRAVLDGDEMVTAVEDFVATLPP